MAPRSACAKADESQRLVQTTSNSQRKSKKKKPKKEGKSKLVDSIATMETLTLKGISINQDEKTGLTRNLLSTPRLGLKDGDSLEDLYLETRPLVGMSFRNSNISDAEEENIVTDATDTNTAGESDHPTMGRTVTADIYGELAEGGTQYSGNDTLSNLNIDTSSAALHGSTLALQGSTNSSEILVGSPCNITFGAISGIGSDHFSKSPPPPLSLDDLDDEHYITSTKEQKSGHRRENSKTLLSTMTPSKQFGNSFSPSKASLIASKASSILQSPTSRKASFDTTRHNSLLAVLEGEQQPTGSASFQFEISGGPSSGSLDDDTTVERRQHNTSSRKQAESIKLLDSTNQKARKSNLRLIDAPATPAASFGTGDSADDTEPLLRPIVNSAGQTSESSKKSSGAGLLLPRKTKSDGVDDPLKVISRMPLGARRTAVPGSLCGTGVDTSSVRGCVMRAAAFAVNTRKNRKDSAKVDQSTKGSPQARTGKKKKKRNTVKRFQDFFESTKLIWV